MLDKRLVHHWAHMLDECFINESQKSSAQRMSLDIQDYWWKNKTRVAPVLCFGLREDMHGLQCKTPTVKEKRAIADTGVVRHMPELFNNMVVAHAYCVGLDDDDWHALVWQPQMKSDVVEFQLCHMMMWSRFSSDEQVDWDAEQKHVFEKFRDAQADILDDEAVEIFIQDYCKGTAASPSRIAEIVYSLPGQYQKIKDDVAAKMPTFYAGWIIPNKSRCANDEERIAKIRSATFYSPEEVLKWIEDNKLQGDIVIPPVEYAYVNGTYQPEEGKATIDTVAKDIVDDTAVKDMLEPYRQIPKIRVVPMSKSQQRHIEKMITDINYRHSRREYGRSYLASGRRKVLKSLKTPDEMQRSKDNSKRRAHLLQAVCKQFYPDLYDVWKNGESQIDRDMARAELVRRLDFTAGGENTLPDRALQVWHGIYDRFMSERKALIKQINDAYSSGDAEAVKAGVEKYNSLCRRYETEAKNSDAVTQLIALDSRLFAPKTEKQLVQLKR